MAKTITLTASLPAEDVAALAGREFTFLRPHTQVREGVPMTATIDRAWHSTITPGGVGLLAHGVEQRGTLPMRFSTALFLPYGTVLTPVD